MRRTASAVALAAAVAAAALMGIGPANAVESTAENAEADGTSAAGRLIQVEQWHPAADSWAPYNYARFDPGEGWRTFVPPANRVGTARLGAPATGTGGELVTPGSTATVAVQPIPGPALNSAIAPVELKFAVTGPGGTKVYLQTLVSGTWVHSNTGYTAADGNVTFTVPAAGENSPATSSAQFRAVVPSPSGGYRDSISATRTVNIENPHRYTGERRAYWGLVAQNCPTALLVIDESLIAKGASGWANMSGNTVHMMPGVPLVHQRYVANHECAHLKQWQMYDTRWAAFLAAADNVYGGGPEYGYERMADCVANAWHPVTYWGYKRGCAGHMGVVGEVFANGQSPFRVR